MRTLAERLDGLRSHFAIALSDEARTIMHNQTEGLRESGILDRIPAVGDSLASFELPDNDGNLVRSTEVLANGPMIVTFYRGGW